MENSSWERTFLFLFANVYSWRVFQSLAEMSFGAWHVKSAKILREHRSESERARELEKNFTSILLFLLLNEYKLISWILCFFFINFHFFLSLFSLFPTILFLHMFQFSLTWKCVELNIIFKNKHKYMPTFFSNRDLNSLESFLPFSSGCVCVHVFVLVLVLVCLLKRENNLERGWYHIIFFFLFSSICVYCCFML